TLLFGSRFFPRRISRTGRGEPPHGRSPEIPSPAPALGGIILEPEETEPEKQPGFEIPLQAAPVPRRILAGACDGLVVTSACVLFALIFFKLTAFVPRSPGLLVLAVGIGCFFWAGYQCMLMV